MLKLRVCLGLLTLLLPAANASTVHDQFTPLTASTLTPASQPFPGTDGRLHLVYELLLTNTSPTPATLKTIEVVDSSDTSKVLANFSGPELLLRLRSSNSAPVESATIEFNGTRLFLIDLSLDAAAVVPQGVSHHLELTGASGPGRTPAAPVRLSYTVAPLKVVAPLPAISAPLSGKGWVAVNGCCNPMGVHRGAGLAVNGKIRFAQRFAIDWMRLDSSGNLVHGDPSDVHSYSGYGADVLAVADGKVVDILNDLGDQQPGALPDPKTINIDNVDGNHIVLDLGNGLYAFYAHLQKGSIAVEAGNRVKRGQVLAKLGNSGNTSAPHLHFHLMDGPSVLGSSGIPYKIDSFDLAGQVSQSDFAKATGVEGNFSKGLLATPSARSNEFPLDLNVINLPPAE